MLDVSLPAHMVAAFVGTSILLGALVYLRFAPEAPRGLGWWAVGLGLFAAQYPPRMAAGPVLGEAGTAFLAESLTAVSAVYLLAGSAAFVRGTVHRGLIAVAATAVVGWATAATVLDLGAVALAVPLTLFGGLATTHAGHLLMRNRQPALWPVQGIAAVLLLAWGLLKLGTPLLDSLGAYAAWGPATELLLGDAVAVALILLTHRQLLTRATRELEERVRSENALRENERGQSLVSGISARLATAANDQIEDRIHECLIELRAFLACDRVAMLIQSEDGTQAIPVDVVSPDPGRELPSPVSVRTLPWHFARFRAGETIHFQRLADLPAEATVERDLFGHMGLETYLSVPLKTGDDVLGAISFACFKRTADWSEAIVGRLRLVGEIIATALARKRAVDTLRDTANRFQLAVNGAHEGLWDWDMATRRIWFSPVWQQMIGFTDAEMADYRWQDHLHPEDMGAVRLGMREHFTGRTPVFQVTFRHRHRDGHWIWVEARGACARDDDGKPVNFAGHLTDISERKEAEENLQRQTNYDHLTGLPTNHLALPRLDDALRAMGLNRHKVAVIAIASDEIEHIASTLGRAARDAALLQIAGRLRDGLGPGQWLSRSATNEFLAVLPNVATSTLAEQTALTLLETAHEPLVVEGQGIVVTLNAGISMAPTDGDSAPVMVRNAHAALAKAREAGGNTHSFFSPALRADGARRLAMRARLRDAIANDELTLRYQPLIDAAAGTLIGAEVLLRWENPEFGTVGQDQFIPLAEETGLIVPIGEWVLRTACQRARSWYDRAGRSFRLSVNVSPRQIRNGEILSAVRDALMLSGLPAAALELEITEGLIVEHASDTRDILERLHEMGCRLTVDDFGTGYSSLSYLQRYPFDALKIDQSFVRNLPDKPSDVALVTAILAMAKGLGLKSTGEGVETRRQMNFLRAHGCDVVQGYLFGRPLTAEAFQARLESGNLAGPPDAGSAATTTAGDGEIDGDTDAKH
ncbi:MAG: EAL domain-containing protein [Hyphomicrobiales bacterium]|nr:EAL domain-containing protein [Hyphomicrobiales bacterium]MCP5372838.1 EAL domain-containing protein [Hyphomicrobiales bacterium]